MALVQILTQYAADGKTVIAQQRISGVRALPVPPGWTDTTSDPSIVFVPPNPTTIPAGEFFARFPAAALPAIWKAILADGTGQLGVGLVNGLANQMIDLTSAVTASFVNSFVSAGVITQAEATAILTP